MYSILKKYGFSKNFNLVCEESPKKKNNNAFQLLMDEHNEQEIKEKNVAFIDLYKSYNNKWSN